MKNVSELKRALKLGAKIEMLTYNGAKPQHVDGIRTVVKVQTNGVYLAPTKESHKTSFFDFPKASDITFESSERFIIRDKTEDGKVWCVREYVLHETKSFIEKIEDHKRNAFINGIF